MPLTSPRFRREPELLAVAAGQALLRRGVRGRHVHLVQMALLDLGHPMRESTANKEYSPDGIYGPETQDTVRAFQRTVPGLVPDGVVGRLTMRALDRRHAKFTHRVNLHFRALSNTRLSFHLMLSHAERVYAQYGIELRAASAVSLGLSEADRERFTVIKQDCVWDVGDGEFAALHRLGPPFPISDVGVFIADMFQNDGEGGCGGHAPDRPACTINWISRPWDMAHELCHVLLTSNFIPTHSRDRRNLMFTKSQRDSMPPGLTDKQLAKIRSSPLCHAI